MLASNDQAKEDLHLFASLVSSVIVVVTGQEEPMAYLGSIANRVDSKTSRGAQIQNKV
jgi:hypothetical protein